MNNDGTRDIVSGSWPGEIYVAYGRNDGTFAKPKALKDRNGDVINVGLATTVALEDWDRDGDADMTIGVFDGEVFFVLNENGQFGEAVALKANGKVIRASKGGPAIADWNGDGTLDLLLGEESGQVRFFPNKSKKGMPSLGEAVVLVSAAPPESEAAANMAKAASVPGTRAKLDVADWNGDGKLDLLLGDYVSTYADKSYKPDLTEAQQKELADAQAKLIPLMMKQQELNTELSEKVLGKMGLDSLKQVRKDKQLAAQFEELMEEAKADSTEWKESKQEFDTTYGTMLLLTTTSYGKVWVFLRKS